MGPRLSGLTSIFGVVFFVSKSPVGIERQKKLEKFAILTRKPRSHAWILIYRTWPIGPSETKYFSLPYTSTFCLYEAAVKWKTIQRLSNYINMARSAILSSKKFRIFLRFHRSHVCFHLWKIMASDYFNTVQALEMVLRGGSDLEDELTIVKAISIWHVVSFFRETEVFLKDRVYLCRRVTGLCC